MQEPTLVILAAGMGSRFGGLKQITAVDEGGHAIIDFSMFDAYRAGFRKVAFIIKHEIEGDFKRIVGRRAEKYFDVKYVYQQLDCLPRGYSVPEGRVKPWGTGHAVSCCAGIVDGPFAVINADDFYGPSAFTALYDFLSQDRPADEHAMVAYLLRNTEDGENYVPLSGDTQVSMNCWGFGASMLDELVRRFPAWLDENVPANPLKCEYFLPFVANSIIKEKLGTVRVLDCGETWYGITYREDMQSVVDAIKDMRRRGIYPEALLD